ncbi:hypothetical protein GGR56DRAFT_239048 [Xylariaceae sp. FL0804]|nr:hypothetical protein GGR56DRAFT_239048 [Xylariaceae sp. FL0804]
MSRGCLASLPGTCTRVCSARLLRLLAVSWPVAGRTLTVTFRRLSGKGLLSHVPLPFLPRKLANYSRSPPEAERRGPLTDSSVLKVLIASSRSAARHTPGQSAGRAGTDPDQDQQSSGTSAETSGATTHRFWRHGGELCSITGLRSQPITAAPLRSSGRTAGPSARHKYFAIPQAFTDMEYISHSRRSRARHVRPMKISSTWPR